MLGPDALDFPEGRESLYTLARCINDFMPAHMLRLTDSALAQAGKTLKGAKIAFLGWAFINDSDDARNIPAEPYYEATKAVGAEVAARSRSRPGDRSRRPPRTHPRP